MEKIIKKDVTEQYKEDMARYAITANRRRSTPEFRDGLKLVHRRIVHMMYQYEKCISEKTKVKSMAIVGSALKVVHPHGDTAVYNAMKPLTNWFEINMPLIVGQGNWGNFKGSNSAAARYTEAYLSKFALDCVISDIQESKQVVDWFDTYDGRTQEPEYMPVSVPLLLINGAFGIGLGMMTSIPKHNFNEVIDATIKLIKDPDASIELIPDHCMPCEIIKTNFKAIGDKGQGNYKVRGIIDIEEYKGRQALVIKSTPDLVFLNSVTDKLEELILSNKIIGIQDTAEEHTNFNMRYVIILKKGADPNFVKEMIYKNTSMESTSIVNFETLNGLEPIRMSYKSYLLAFIEFRKLTKFRLYCNRLQQVETKLHERDAYIKVLESGEINNIISMIQKQKTIDDNVLIEYLIKKINITDLQAAFIIGSDLKKLSMGYLNKYKTEAAELDKSSSFYLNKIVNDDFDQEIIDELMQYKKLYGKPRKCKIISAKDATDIPNGDFKVIITENNFVKKVGLNDSIGSFRGDNPKHILKVENVESILIFDEQGKVFKLPVNKIPFTDKNSTGTDIRMIVKNLTSNINTIMYEPVLKDLNGRKLKHFVTVITTGGNIKKLDIEDFLAVPPSGILFMKMDNGDTIKEVTIVADLLDIIVYSNSKALRMHMNEIPHLKRNTKGVKSISTKECIDGVSIIYPNTTDIVVITESGKINRFDVVALPCLGRNKTGSNVIKLGKGDAIHSIYGVNSNDTIRVVTKNTRVDIPVADIESSSSISQGVKILPMKADNIIKCMILKQK